MSNRARQFRQLNDEKIQIKLEFNDITRRFAISSDKEEQTKNYEDGFFQIVNYSYLCELCMTDDGCFLPVIRIVLFMAADNQ